MREELLNWFQTYPRDPAWRDGSFAGAPAVQTVTRVVPEACRAAAGAAADRYLIHGSAGKGDWTHTPWVAILDPSETSTVEEGIYIVYLMSHGCERLYLTLNQGCTRLKDDAGIPGTRAELNRRAAAMRERLNPKRLSSAPIDLNTGVWRADLYEHGSVLSVAYTEANLPSDDDLRNDLEEALRLYRRILDAGGWAPDDEIASEATQELGEVPLVQAKRYRRHRHIERNAAHSRAVKKLQGTICKACGRDPAEFYGPTAAGMVDAHHLHSLASLETDEVVTFDPVKDFAVLCPSCHRAIHRLEDVGDVEALRSLIEQHGKAGA